MQSNKIYIVGIGPGAEALMTMEARAVLQECDVIVGYTTYLELLAPIFAEKELLSTPMKQEIARCRLCYEKAREGKKVALVCSGDAGIYGMAAPMYELLKEYPDCALELVSGVTAAVCGAALLGAPINHDFCVISLSDLLTPWETIERRLTAAARGDFVVVLYNPSSRKRADYLKRACEILMSNGCDEKRACGYVRNIGREGESAATLTLRELADTQVDMFTTVFIGNSQTVLQNGKLITPRGYCI